MNACHVHEPSLLCVCASVECVCVCVKGGVCGWLFVCVCVGWEWVDKWFDCKLLSLEMSTRMARM